VANEVSPPSVDIPKVDIPDLVGDLDVDMIIQTETEIDELEKFDEQTLILGIETSCDETGVAILRGGNQVLANIISSSADLHSKYGGVVPEVASRAHVQALNPAIAEALRKADVTLWDMSAIAVTVGPGLVGSLIVGVAAAKALASVLEVPLLGINHLEAHIYANFLEHPDFAPPCIGLIVSGGHTLLVHMPAHGLYEVLGETLDDAAGEAFDKIARYLGIGYPGGPAIDQMALGGSKRAIKFPRAMLKKGYDFSFSGLKTSVRDYIRKQEEAGNEINLADVCASFQEAVVDVQVHKTIKAAQEYNVTNVFVSGGVAANSRLRELMTVMCEENDLRLFFPSPVYCTDNAAMVACCGHYRFQRGIRADPNIDPDPNLHLA
jgi:N6-L-threonylcarbamoyladenine synthase